MKVIELKDNVKNIVNCFLISKLTLTCFFTKQ